MTDRPLGRGAEALPILLRSTRFMPQAIQVGDNLGVLGIAATWALQMRRPKPEKRGILTPHHLVNFATTTPALRVTAPEDITATEAPDQSTERQSLTRFRSKRASVEAGPEQISRSLATYADMLRAVTAQEDQDPASSLTLSEITHSLSITGKGTIGIAPTEGQASITLVFQRE